MTRLAGDRFRVITGAGTVDADLGWLMMHAVDGDGPVELREASEEHAVIGLWGPSSRDVLATTTDDEITNEAFSYLTAREIEVGAASVFAQRVSYVGEPGWELYVEPEWAVQVWDRLWDAGRPFELEACGYRVLDGLRLERGYRYFGTDLTASDTPDEAGLSFCVQASKDFVGREALLAARSAVPAKRLCTLVVGDEDYLTVYGGEAVRAGDEVVGRLRSCAYGFTVGRNLAFAYLPPALGPGDRLKVEVFGDLVPAEVAEDVLVDPEGKRMRS